MLLEVIETIDAAFEAVDSFKSMKGERAVHIAKKNGISTVKINKESGLARYMNAEGEHFSIDNETAEKMKKGLLHIAFNPEKYVHITKCSFYKDSSTVIIAIIEKNKNDKKKKSKMSS